MAIGKGRVDRHPLSVKWVKAVAFYSFTDVPPKSLRKWRSFSPSLTFFSNVYGKEREKDGTEVGTMNLVIVSRMSMRRLTFFFFRLLWFFSSRFSTSSPGTTLSLDGPVRVPTDRNSKEDLFVICRSTKFGYDKTKGQWTSLYMRNIDGQEFEKFISTLLFFTCLFFFKTHGLYITRIQSVQMSVKG